MDKVKEMLSSTDTVTRVVKNRQKKIGNFQKTNSQNVCGV